MNDADRLAYNTFEKSFLDTLAPVGPVETQFAISIAQDHWRLNRSRAIEYNTYGLGHHEHEGDLDTDSPEVDAAITQAKTWRDYERGFTNIPLYETRVRRLIALNEKCLEELQAVRKAAEAKAREEAELLLCQMVMDGEEISESKPIVIYPARQPGLIATNGLSLDQTEVNGFVFSPSKLIAGINQRTALERARFYGANNWDNSIPWKGAFRFDIKTTAPLPKAA